MAVVAEAPKKMGRPQREINWTLFEDLCSIQCTQSEIASVLHIHIDTVRDRVVEHYGDTYSNVYKEYSEGGKTCLRRMQLKLAAKSAAMAIFLGKQWLGQRDNDQTIQLSPEAIASFKSVMEQLSKHQGTSESPRPPTSQKSA